MSHGNETVLVAVQQTGFVDYILEEIGSSFNSRLQSSPPSSARWKCPKDPLFDTPDEDDQDSEVEGLDHSAQELEVKLPTCT